MVGNHHCILKWQARPSRHYSTAQRFCLVAWLNSGNKGIEHRREHEHRRCQGSRHIPSMYKPLSTLECGLYRRTAI